MKLIPVTHQFSLFDYNQMRPRLKVPIKRISRQRMEEALRERNKDNGRKLINVLRDINDSLEVYCKKRGIK